MLKLFDEGTVFVDIQKDSPGSSALREIEGPAIAAEPGKYVRQLCPQARDRHEVADYDTKGTSDRLRAVPTLSRPARGRPSGCRGGECDHSGVTRWSGALFTLAAIGTAIALVQLLPWPTPAVRDFPPFLMTIEEWDAVRIGYSDGRTIGGTAVYRLEYHRRDHWNLSLVSDDLGSMAPGQGNACRDGAYGQLDPAGTFRVTSTDPAFCNGVGRWVHYGIAWRYPWKRESANGRIAYTDPGERVDFDIESGLPLLYETGPVEGAVAHRTVYRVDRWLGPRQ